MFIFGQFCWKFIGLKENKRGMSEFSTTVGVVLGALKRGPSPRPAPPLTKNPTGLSLLYQGFLKIYLNVHITSYFLTSLLVLFLSFKKNFWSRVYLHCVSFRCRVIQTCTGIYTDMCLYVYVCACICMCVCVFFFIFFSIMVYYKILNIVPCAIQQDLTVYLLYIQQFVSANS